MIIQGEELDRYIFGAVNSEMTPHGKHYMKCMPEEIQDWHEANSETLGPRSALNCGVMCDFHTNSKHVRFTVWQIKFDVLVNGCLVHQVLGAVEKAYRPIDITLNGEDNRVTLVFPNHRNGYLRDITVDDGAYVTPHCYDTKFLFYGDSITQGWNSSFDSLSFAHRFSEMYNAERVINGIGGAYFRASAFYKIPYEPDVVFIAFGTNDLRHYTDKEEFEANVTGYLNKVKDAYPRAFLVDILPIWRMDEDIEVALGTFPYVRNFIKKSCDERGIPTIDGYELVPHFEEFYADYLHPNNLGFQLYAENLKKAVDKLLEERK